MFLVQRVRRGALAVVSGALWCSVVSQWRRSQPRQVHVSLVQVQVQSGHSRGKKWTEQALAQPRQSLVSGLVRGIAIMYVLVIYSWKFILCLVITCSSSNVICKSKAKRRNNFGHFYCSSTNKWCHGSSTVTGRILSP